MNDTTTPSFLSGERVYWTDPEGETSGWYTIAETVADIENDSVLLRDEFGDISNEAWPRELSLSEIRIEPGDRPEAISQLEDEPPSLHDFVEAYEAYDGDNVGLLIHEWEILLGLAPEVDRQRVEYRHTHQSVHDSSPAMSLGMVAGVLMLMNEEGDTWVSDPASWRQISNHEN